MDETAQPRYPPDASFNGGDLDCGSGLLLLIRKHIDPLARGQILEVRSTEPSVEQDLPSWCRLTGNELLSSNRSAGTWSFLICKGSLAERKQKWKRQGFPNGRRSRPRLLTYRRYRSWESAAGRDRAGCSGPCTNMSKDG